MYKIISQGRVFVKCAYKTALKIMHFKHNEYFVANFLTDRNFHQTHHQNATNEIIVLKYRPIIFNTLAFVFEKTPVSPAFSRIGTRNYIRVVNFVNSLRASKFTTTTLWTEHASKLVPDSANLRQFLLCISHIYRTDIFVMHKTYVLPLFKIK